MNKPLFALQIGIVAVGVAFAEGTTTIKSGTKVTYASESPASGTIEMGIGAAEVQAGGFGSGVNISQPGEGYFRLYGSETVNSLSGTSAGGRIDIADGKTLTVSQEGDTAYAGRLTGGGSFVKNGSGELVYSGKGTYSGATTVSAGTLTLRHPISAEGLVAAYRFEDSANPGAVEGVSSAPLKVNGGGVTSIAGVRGGSRAIEFPAGSANNTWMNAAASEVADVFPSGDTPFTLSFWFKPLAYKDDGTGNSDWANMVFWGQWVNGSNSHVWAYLRHQANYKHDVLVFHVGDYANYWEKPSVYVEKPFDYFVDGKWHQAVCTYANRTLSLYLDGELCATKELAAAMAVPAKSVPPFGDSQPSHQSAGGLDEVLIYDRVQTADEIKSAYLTGTVSETDESEILPTPVAHWAFDDSSDKGKDTGPNGYHLQAKWGGWDGTLFHAYGGVQKGDIYKLKDTSVFPAKIPTGNAAFTISARYTKPVAENQPWIAWGGSDNYTYVTLLPAGSPREDILKVGSDWASMWLEFKDDKLGDAIEEPGFHHVICTYNPATRTLTGYRAGMKVLTKTLSQDLNIAASNLRIGGDFDAGKGNWGWIDDIQIFDRTLTDSQVAALARSLGDGKVGSTVPANSSVTVASGATLKVEGTGHACASLAGAGTVLVAGGGRLTVNGASTFAGTVTGGGLLAVQGALSLNGDGSNFSGVVEVGGQATLSLGASFMGATACWPESVAITLSSSPTAQTLLVETPGKVVVPATATVTFPVGAEDGLYVLAKGGSFELPADFTGWTVNDAKARKVKFIQRDGQFAIRLGKPG
ncbi:MAG: hypothetical protein KBT68_10435, partial [bacterium]|nr:hypothetical protein [Candidatus Colisoma equi]